MDLLLRWRRQTDNDSGGEENLLAKMQNTYIKLRWLLETFATLFRPKRGLQKSTPQLKFLLNLSDEISKHADHLRLSRSKFSKLMPLYDTIKVRKSGLPLLDILSVKQGGRIVV